MKIWHNTEDAPRFPDKVRSGEVVEIWVGSYPIEPGQNVFVEMTVVHQDGKSERDQRPASGRFSDLVLANSYWQAGLGPFRKGDQVEYIIHGKSGSASVAAQRYSLYVED